MNTTEIKEQIIARLAAMSGDGFAEGAAALMDRLGYRSERTVPLEPNNADGFIAAFAGDGFNREKALCEQWRSIDLLFQITDSEVRDAARQTALDFDSEGVFDGTQMASYLFFAVDLEEAQYTRTQLSTITRAINGCFPMPAMILFRHGGTLTLAIIDRRLHKREPDRDVLEKVTLIKDIRVASPHRAHVDILYDLALDRLYEAYRFTHFAGLHEAWRKTLDSAELNRKFYRELANWYFWAMEHTVFPAQKDVADDINRATNLIRLITRLIFAWFVKEKGLVPEALFQEHRIRTLLSDVSPEASTYYRAVLQNLFFATFNTAMNTPDETTNRRFRSKSNGRDAHFMVHNVYRYQDYFTEPDAALDLFSSVPFMNGGLFECLDKRVESGNGIEDIRIDGFSDRPENPISVPNFLFFGEEQSVDLNKTYGTKGKRYRTRGLLHILHAYKFTVTENTPIEEEIALDPELLGQAFENLLASYNPETGETARKQTGSFYTPRVVVDYMVDEALVACLAPRLKDIGAEKTHERLRNLLAYNESSTPFTEEEADLLIAAIDRLRILDPACGSGAFPMGALHKLVHILGKLDPGNEKWLETQLNKLDDMVMREELARNFRENYSDYGRKLYLIQHVIYGVDIQPIAVQIAKLRFFISLVADQKISDDKPNRGIRPLPNLETRFVAANTLFGVVRPKQPLLPDSEIDAKEARLAEVRNKHFEARTYKTKQKYRELDARLRGELGELLVKSGFPRLTTEQLAYWDPYDQNGSADFFDPEWMFGIADGFDLVIGNPPYVRQEQIKDLKPALKLRYTCYTGTADLYVYFFERGVQLLRHGGALAYICSNKYFRAGYGANLRGHLASTLTLRQIIDFGDAPVFTAIAYPSILIGRKAPPNGTDVRALNWTPGPTIAEFPAVFTENSFDLAQDRLTHDGWRLESPAALSLLDKLRDAGKPLGDYVEGRFYYGIKTGLNEAFVVDRATRDRLIEEHSSSGELLKPFLRGRDVKRWRAAFDDQYLIKIPSSENQTHPWSGYPDEEAETIFAETYSAIHAWFDAYRDRLIKRDDQGKYFWELRSCAYWQEFEQPKIILGRFMNNPTFAFDREGFFHNDALYMIAGATEYVVAILNSSVSWWFLTHTCTDLQNGYIQAYRENLFQIPIPAASASDRTALTALVERILSAKADDAKADVSALEAEIDERVCRLFGLDAAERELVG